MAGKVWSEEDKKFVQSNLDSLSTKEIGEKIGRTRRAIQHLCNNMGWVKSKPKIGDNIDKLFINNIYLIEKYGQQVSIASCTCKCGNKKDIKLTSIVQGSTTSCGCIRNEKASKRLIDYNTTHDLSRHPLYGLWNTMKRRCYDSNNISYHNYGAKGITVCDEWKDDFLAFYNWSINNGYQHGLSIDRLNSRLGYSPDNCRWTTSEEQNNNRANNFSITAWNETKNLAQWERDSRCKTKAFNIKYRLSQGYTPEEAISTPRFGSYKKHTGN